MANLCLRRTTAAVAVLLAVTLSGPPPAACATVGAIIRSPKPIVPGNSATPTVTVTNTGDIAAPNTVITIPAPPTGYTLGAVTTTGGGECTSTATQIRCSGVTVPGAGGVTVSLPVTVHSSALTAANWAPGNTAILARSTPVAAVAGTTIDVTGGGALVTVLDPQSAGAISLDPITVPAGRAATAAVRLANQGPSDATTTLAVPIGNRPDGLSVRSAAVGGAPCTVAAATITCAGLTVPSGGSATATIRVAATVTTPAKTVWNLQDLGATLNGTDVAGGGRLVAVSDPDVNLSGGVTTDRVTGVPGGPPASPTADPAIPDDNSDAGGGGGDNLPRTGSNIFSLLVFAVLLIATGAAVMLVARDRPRPRPEGSL